MTNKASKPANPIKTADVSRIQSAVAKQHGGQVPKGNYVGRLQRAVDSVNSNKKNGK